MAVHSPCRAWRIEFIHCFHGTWTPVREQRRSAHLTVQCFNQLGVLMVMIFSKAESLKWHCYTNMTTGELAGGFCCGQLYSSILRWTMMGDCLTHPLVCDFFDVVICPKDDLENFEDPRNMWYCRHCQKKIVSIHTATFGHVVRNYGVLPVLTTIILNPLFLLGRT